MLIELQYLPKRKEIAQLNIEYLSTASPDCLRKITSLCGDIAQDCADIDSYLTAVEMPIDDILRPTRLTIEYPTHRTFAASARNTGEATLTALEVMKRRFKLVRLVLKHFLLIHSAGVSRDRSKLSVLLASISNSPITIAMNKAPERAFRACSEIGAGTNRQQAFEIVSICEEVGVEAVKKAFYNYKKIDGSHAQGTS
ncbi:MAG: hypothetical protein ABR905_04735 [Terracidiphilus sp.]